MLIRPTNGDQTPGINKQATDWKNCDNLLLTIFCFLAAFFCYRAILPLVHPEMAYFFQMYGYQPGPTLHQVFSAYNIFQPGWYRPTSFFLFPYLLSLNYLNPAGVVFFNIFFFALTCSLVPILFLPKSDLPTKLLSSSIILTAPALVAVTYFPTIDSLYILFSLLFIIAFEGAVKGNKKILARSSLPLLFWYLAAITCKETSVIIPLIACLYTIINNIDQHPQRRQLLVKATSLALPFLGLSTAYYCLYVVAKGVLSSQSYANIPAVHKLPKILKLLYATLNIHLPIVPGKNSPTAGYLKAGNLTWITIWLITAGLAWWRCKQISLIIKICFLLILASLYLLSGLAGGHFHHVFPMMVCLAILIGRLSLFPESAAAQRLAAKRRQLLKKMLQLTLSVSLVFSCKAYATGILELGESRVELKINTALFHDRQLSDLARRDDIHLLVESIPWELGAGTGVLHYFGRNSNGGASEEYVSRITPAKIRQATIDHPNKIIFGLSIRAEDSIHSIRQLWPLPAQVE